MMYDLPVSVEVGGIEREIRWDYRPILDIMAALNDMELDDIERAISVLGIFYSDLDSIPAEDYGEAVERCMWFINCGNEVDNRRKTPKLMDWEQDFQHIVSPVNRVIGREIRGAEKLHWWSFISAYYEIGDCYFAQIVRIRNKKAKGKKLDKFDQAFYRENKSAVDIKTRYTEAENELLKQWGGGGNGRQG